MFIMKKSAFDLEIIKINDIFVCGASNTSIQIGLITIFNMKMRFVFIYSYKMSHNMQSIRNESIFIYKKKNHTYNVYGLGW